MELEYKYQEFHNHSHFSYLDGISSPKDMAKAAKAMGYRSLALTDHGVIDGWWTFAKACKDEGIQPILSCEFYIAQNMMDVEPNPFNAKAPPRLKRKHIILHAKTVGGIEAIRELYNRSWELYLEKGKKQIILEEDVMRHAGKILVQSACTGSYFDSEDKVIRFKQVFGDDLYLEIQPHILDQDYSLEKKGFVQTEDKQDSHNVKIITWARKHDVNLIITGDAHYPTNKDKMIQDIQILNSEVGKNTGWHFFQDTNHLMDFDQWWAYFTRTESEARKLFTREDAMKSLKIMDGIASKCTGLSLEKPADLREFPLETHELFQPGDSKDALLMRIIKDNNKIDFKDPVYMERLKRELKVIRDKGFVDYFLIYEDIIRWNRKHRYLTGPGRGSAAGSLLAYCLDITKRDPIKRGLYFERFMDVSRNDFPDIDSDFEMQKETMEYIKEKYGKEYFANIGAYQTVKVKTALKNAYKTLYNVDGRIYDYNLVNAITKNIPETNARGDDVQTDIFKELLLEAKEQYERTIEKGGSVPYNNLYAFLSNKPDLVKAVGKLLGKITNMRVHPCSIIITKNKVADVLPLVVIKPGTKSAQIITAFDGPGVEGCGEIKLDILGLKAMNIVSESIRLILERHGVDFFDKIWDLPVDDPKVLAKMREGDTHQVFQFNTSLLRGICIQLGVTTFEDLVAIVALGRPGPLKAGYVETYIKRKSGELKADEMFHVDAKGVKKIIKVKYSHPRMDEVLKDTYGVIVYQEQVMRLFVELGGFTLAETNPVRKAIAKGKKENLAYARPKFEAYATSQEIGWTVEQVDAFFDDIVGFGSYCFNLSHSDCYAYLGYVCQYLKVYYPHEWWAANLMHAGEKGVKGVLEIINKNVPEITIAGIDINKSKMDFFISGEIIATPFKFLEGVGDTGLPYIINGQPYLSLEDFNKRMPGRSVRKNAVISLICAGAFNSLYPDKTPQQILEYYFLKVKKVKNMEPEIQLLIDDSMAFERLKQKNDPFYQPDWVEKFEDLFSSDVVAIADLEDYGDGAVVSIGGQIEKIDQKIDKNGNAWYDLTLRHTDSTCKVKIFKNQVQNMMHIIDKGEGQIVEVYGKINVWQGHKSVMVINMNEIDVDV